MSFSRPLTPTKVDRIRKNIAELERLVDSTPSTDRRHVETALLLLRTRLASDH